MLSEPPVLWSRWSIICPSNNAKVGWLFRALAITEPNMTSRLLDLILERVVNRELQSSHIIDLVHLLEEIRPVPIAAVVSFMLVLRQEEPRVDEFVQQRLVEFI